MKSTGNRIANRDGGKYNCRALSLSTNGSTFYIHTHLICDVITGSRERTREGDGMQLHRRKRKKLVGRASPMGEPMVNEDG
jgi:hypothetical protein